MSDFDISFDGLLVMCQNLNITIQKRHVVSCKSSTSVVLPRSAIAHQHRAPLDRLCALSRMRRKSLLLMHDIMRRIANISDRSKRSYVCYEYLERERFRDALFELACVHDVSHVVTLDVLLDSESTCGEMLQDVVCCGLLRGETNIARDRSKRDGVCLELFLATQLVHALAIKSQISLGVIDHLYAIESAILKENCLKSYVSKAVRARRAQRSQSWIRKTLTKSDENLVNYVIKSYLAKVGVPEDDVISHGDAIALLFKLRSDIIHCNKVGMITTKIPRQSMVPRCGPVTFHMTPTFWNKFGGPCRSSQCKIHSSLDLLKDSVKEALQKRYDDVRSKTFLLIFFFVLCIFTTSLCILENECVTTSLHDHENVTTSLREVEHTHTHTHTQILERTHTNTNSFTHTLEHGGVSIRSRILYLKYL